MAETRLKPTRLLVIEEEEIFRYMYELLPLRGPIELLGVSASFDAPLLKELMSTRHPEVVLLGTEKIESANTEALEQIREQHPEVGIVLFFSSYSAQQIEPFRKMALKSEGGIAVFSRQSLRELEQVIGIILAVTRGQIILDPVLANFMLGGKTSYPFLRELTTRELEILSLLSKGYTNSSIAEALYIDVKTVEHHLNSTYAKLKSNGDLDNRHPRVTAARLYLQEIDVS